MDDQVISREKLEQIEKQLVEVIIKAYGDGTISYYELKQSGRYILSHIDIINNHEQLLNFLGNLSSYWPIFAPLATLESAKDQQLSDQEKILELQKIIKSLQ